MTSNNTISKPEGMRSSGVARAVMMAVVLIISFANSSLAQPLNTVTLKYDGGDGVTGELTEFSNGLFRLSSSVGSIVIPAEGTSCIGRACPEGTRLDTGGDLLSLTAHDGSFKLTGALLEISGGRYVLATDIGEISIDASKVRCDGIGCAAEEEVTEYGGNVVMVGAGGSLEGVLIDNLAEVYLVDVPLLGLVRIRKDTYDCTGSGCP